MSLDQNINNELKEAMLSKNEVKLRTIKAIKAAFLIAKTEKGATGEITQEQEIKILQKLFNQRKESFEIFTKENRAELAVREKEEMDIITSYLPAQMSDDELKAVFVYLESLPRLEYGNRWRMTPAYYFIWS